MTPDFDRLRDINTFRQLVVYLRDELDWPIEGDDFEDLTFEYSADDLGLDSATAAKIKEIKQLRPLNSKQPWGIFFVNFEPKKLPIVALRRILNRLVLKKRQSANKAHQAAWRLHDLLFISSYGESNHRNMTFAHFAEEKEYGDLPTLRVLGWDDEDAPLHISHAERILKAKLRWPQEESQVEAWRTQWSSAFTLRPREVITTSKMLAVRLAELARSIRKRANAVLRIETDKGSLRKLYAAFKEALIHDLSEDDFADMYAQTISYGLLTARVSRPAGLVAENLSDMVPITNPFLKELLQTFLTIGGRKGKIDFDELGVNEVVQLLRDADMEAVLRDFGDRNPQEDPVIHFYELFLKEYDSQKRLKRGVFYTPRPVVSFIVRSVHEILQEEFGLEDGLADITTWNEILTKHTHLRPPKGVSLSDPFVQILDPATGTGTFLVEVIDIVYQTLRTKWKAKTTHEFNCAWNQYVSQNLLPRLYGFELMMAPYAIAHMKIGLKLFETGYRFEPTGRVRVFLTNTLEQPIDLSGVFAEMAPALAHEAKAVGRVKTDAAFTVLIGNPPYSKLSSNLSAEARALVEQYKFIDGTRIAERGALQFEINLQDDYVKFMRYCEQQLARNSGVLGLITNSGFLSTPTLRGMRYSLRSTFTNLQFLDLHGHSATAVTGADGTQDQNVFDILQGVSISLCVRRGAAGASSVEYDELIGSREAKYDTLGMASSQTLDFQTITLRAPLYLFVERDADLSDEFQAMTSLPDLFPRNSAGFISSRDGLLIGESRSELVRRIDEFRNDRSPEAEVYSRFGFQPSKRLDLREAQRILRKEKDLERYIRPVTYRPFDRRFVFYHRDLIESFKPIAFEMRSSHDLALIATRQVTRKQFEHVFVSRAMAEIKVCSHDRNSQIFPMLTGGVDEDQEQAALLTKRVANINATFIDGLEKSTNRQFTDSNSGDDQVGFFGPENVLQYVYAVLHSPEYRGRYYPLLRSEFPRIPIPRSGELFDGLIRYGSELINCHLLEFASASGSSPAYEGPLHPEVEKPSYCGGVVWLDKSMTSGFKTVPEAVWNYYIGGYQVCEKWLKDRKGRKLSKADIGHYQKIVVALQETIRIMAEIDRVIDAHGGWPGAFVTSGDAASKDASA